MGGIADVRPGRTWSRRFNHPYTSRKYTPPPALPVLGTNKGAPWELFNSGFGPVYGYRGYNYPGSGVPASYPGPDALVPAGLPASATVISIVPDITQTLAGTLDTALAAFFATVPPGAYVCAWAEAELNGYGTASQNVAGLARLYGLFNANAPASASFGQIVAATSSISGNGGYPLTPWVSAPSNGGIVLDFYGMDVGFTNATTTMSFTVGSAIAMMVAAGVPQSGPWTLTEVSWNPAWHGTQNQWYSDGWNVAQAIGAIHYFFFFGSGGAAPFWPPGNRNVIPVLQDIAAVSRGDPRAPAATVPARSTQAPFASSAGTTSLTTTFSSNPAAGAKVLATVQAPSGATITVTDNGTTGGTFWLDACCLNASGSIPSVFVFRADNITLPGSGTYAVTVTLGSSAAVQVCASAYTGVANGPPSATSSVTGNSNNPALGPVTPADQSSVFYSAFFCTSAASPETMAVASGEFTLQQAQPTPATGYPGAVADAVVTSPAVRQGGWTLPDSPNWSAVMAAYGAVPAKVEIVSGAEMTWAQAPTAVPGLSVNAGLASASGWAAVSPPSTAVTVSPGVAPGTATAPYSTAGGTISLTLTAVNPVQATGAAQLPVPSVAATAGLAAAAGAANAPALGYTAGLASGSAAGLAPVANVAPNAALAAATGAANGPAGSLAVTAGLGAATGAAGTPVASIAVNAGLAAASAAALNATVNTSSGTNANAGLAAATAAALAPVASVSVFPAAGAATGLALQAAAQAGAAAGSAAALQAVPSIAVNAGLATATAAALTPTVITGIVANAGLAAATGTAQSPVANVQPTAGTAAATGAAQKPGLGFIPGLASASAAALQAVPGVTPAAGLAAATGTAQAIGHGAGVPVATGTAAASAPVLTLLAQAAAAQALAAALDAAGRGVAAFTVGTLTAATAAGTVATVPPGAYVNNMYRAAPADFTGQSALWTALSGTVAKSARYYKALSDFTYDTNMAEMTAAGVKMCLTLRPAYNPVSAGDLAAMTALLAAMKAAGAQADITLWHEPFFGGLSAAQFTTMIAYYGPAVRQYYPLVFVGSGPDLILGNGYYPGDSAVDKIACDQYAFGAVSPDPGASIDNAAAIADAAVPPKPLGLWEFNGSTDLVTGQSQAFVTTWLGNVQSFFAARTAAGKANADILLFNSGTGNWLGNATNQNCGFEGGIGNWVTNANCSLAGTAAQALEGAGALAVTSSAAGAMSAASCAFGSITTQGLPIAAGQTAVIGGEFRAAAIARGVRVGVQWATAAGGFISTVFAGTAPSDSTSAWTLTPTSLVAPATTGFARALVQWETPAAGGEVHYVDNAFMYAAQPANSLTTTIWSALDYRVALYTGMLAALNAVPVPASLASSDARLGVLTAATAP